MTKSEIKKIASDCGYEAIYSGKENKFFFNKLEGVQNIRVDPEKLEKFESLIKNIESGNFFL